MGEAYMMRLAPTMGRGKAHDVVYRAASEAREKGLRLEEALKQLLPEDIFGSLNGWRPLAPEEYLGQPDLVCDAALKEWRYLTAKTKEDKEDYGDAN
jgi:3-carboxy-cis,cis-muconate cycloisomerase